MQLDKDTLNKLGQPFSEDEIEFLPRAQSNGKALGLAYIDARTVMNRLDSVVGAENWHFDFDVLDPHGKLVRGRLTVCGVTKSDAGEAATEEEILKSAVSDALKRAAVHFGIGRYLYYLPRVWAPYDAQKHRFTETPKLERPVVNHALRVCGITPLNAAAAPAPSRPAAPAPASRENAPSAPRSAPQTAPERWDAPTAPKQGALLETPGQCPECHAPNGRHASKCSKSIGGNAMRSGL